jgi:hypothetical protein
LERASPDLLAAVERHGRTITVAQPGSEEMRYLDYMGAEANVGGAGMTHILVRANPGKAAVLEEFLHGTQARLGIIDRLGTRGAEVHVKDFMIRHRVMLGLGDEDVEALRTLLTRERGQLGDGRQP